MSTLWNRFASAKSSSLIASSDDESTDRDESDNSHSISSDLPPDPLPLRKRLRLDSVSPTAQPSLSSIASSSPKWQVISQPRQLVGRAAAVNFLRARPGLTAYSRGVSTPLEAWSLTGRRLPTPHTTLH